MDTDYLLNLEQKFYQEGYEEGICEKAKENHIEGKQFGLQVGFQRFLIVGQIQGIVQVLKSVSESRISSRNLQIIDELLAGFVKTNADDAVADYESRLIKVRNKLRNVLLSLDRQSGKITGRTLTLEDVEKVCSRVAGDLKAYVDDENKDKDLTPPDHAMEW